MYVEKVPSFQGFTWAVRQTVVFQRYDKITKQNVWLLLHPREDSALQKALEEAVKDKSTLTLNWDFGHRCLMTSYLSNWGYFLRDLGTELADVVSTRAFSR